MVRSIAIIATAFLLQLPSSSIIYDYTDFMAVFGYISKISQALILSIKKQAHVTN
jgi:hypothetical protein